MIFNMCKQNVEETIVLYSLQKKNVLEGKNIFLSKYFIKNYTLWNYTYTAM